ncbi:esterase YqiA [Vibrio palustris]|uniref:Esterase YqiA n=1 Tax=Vibrio palustris TaxID=1918946 RepID=A0A1R4B8X7_9VIBR|nr:esterase YqiA [Vibrio palustris]SJL85377.1 esterase YqiA [Vibrio palustris]
MKPSLLIYVHGFNSSPGSLKASLMAKYCAEHRPDIRVEIPQLPNFPEQAAYQLKQLVEEHQNDYRIGLAGSSLGGYFCTWLNAHYALPAVLINPAVKPYELLVDFLGVQINPYTHESYVLNDTHIDDLKVIDVETLTNPDNIWVLLQTGDETLDYRQAEKKYQSAHLTIESGGDHGFVDFERYPERIIQFLNL